MLEPKGIILELEKITSEKNSSKMHRSRFIYQWLCFSEDSLNTLISMIICPL